MRILITGTAGFIGHHLSLALVGKGHEVDGIDNINDYYAVELKYGRLEAAGFDKAAADSGDWAASRSSGALRFRKADIAARQAMESLFLDETYDMVIHLAAQAGVRYSLENPHAYVESNIVGFLHVLEGCRSRKTPLLYASSSSVYGGNEKVPFAESDRTDSPVSLYAATKKADELMAASYAHLYGFPAVGLRFFTVYGPWGRPDMAYFLFTRAILEGRPIKVFNNGDMKRDFTYINDIVSGISGLVETPDALRGARVFNIGNSSPEDLMEFIGVLEKELGRTAVKEFLPMQDGDVPATWAETAALNAAVGYEPTTSIAEGIPAFVSWYREYYGIE